MSDKNTPCDCDCDCDECITERMTECVESEEHAREFGVPLFQHTKTGGLYQFESFAVLESDLTLMVNYRNSRGILFTRPAKEFFDGRFAPVMPSKEEPLDKCSADDDDDGLN